MRTKTCVWLALCATTALSVGLMVLAIFFYDYDLNDTKNNDEPDDSYKTIRQHEASLVLFYSLEDPNKEFQDNWLRLRDKIHHSNNTRNVYMGRMECSVFRLSCHSFGVDRYPAIVWLENGRVKEHYVGDDKLESMKLFFDKHASLEKRKVNIKIKTNIEEKVTEVSMVDRSTNILDTQNTKKASTVGTKLLEPASKSQNILSTSENVAKISTSESAVDHKLSTESVKIIEKTVDTTTIETNTDVESEIPSTEVTENATETGMTESMEKQSHKSVEAFAVNPKTDSKEKKPATSNEKSSETTEKIEIDDEINSKEKSEETSSKSPSSDSKESFETTTTDSSSFEGLLMTRPNIDETSNEEDAESDETEEESSEDESTEEMPQDETLDIGKLFQDVSHESDKKEETEENDDDDDNTSGDAEETTAENDEILIKTSKDVESDEDYDGISTKAHQENSEIEEKIESLKRDKSNTKVEENVTKEDKKEATIPISIESKEFDEKYKSKTVKKSKPRPKSIETTQKHH